MEKAYRRLYSARRGPFADTSLFMSIRLLDGIQLATGSEEWSCSSCCYTSPERDGFPLLAPGQTGGFDPTSFERLASIEAGSFWFQARKALIIDLLRLHAPNATSLLEVGCGTGYMLASIRDSFPNVALTGGDLHTEGLVYARQRLPGATLIQLDARRLPFEQEFDVIGAFDVLEHIFEDEEAMVSIRNALRVDGLLVITVPQHRMLWSKADDYGHHQRRYARRELKEKLTRAGFEIMQITGFVTSLLPLMLASRLWDRSSKRKFDPTREHTAGKLITNCLLGALNTERAVIRRGISLPVGGSLVAVARPSLKSTTSFRGSHTKSSLKHKFNVE